MSELATFTVERYKRADVITVSGRVDSSNANKLAEVLQETMDLGQRNIVMELSALDYLSSAGLRHLVSTLKECRKANGDLRVATPSERVNEVLEMAGLKSLIPTYDSLAAAVGSF
jgi:anti-sigma B factor antagonist